MACENCGHEIRISKALGVNKSSSRPEECPECGEKLKSDNRLEKGL